MNLSNRRTWVVLRILSLALVLSACGGTSTPQDASPTSAPVLTAMPTPTPSPEPPQPPTATPTATPTPETAPVLIPSPTPPASVCQGLSGQLEVQILVGPAEAVGLEPVAVGSVPFAVTTSSPPYLVEGQGPLSYEATLTEKWGTYAVTMDMETSVLGECAGATGSEQLDLVLVMSGEQLVVVDAEGFDGEYPWSGTQSRDLAFPIEEGASAQGEGWAVVLHVSMP